MSWRLTLTQGGTCRPRSCPEVRLSLPPLPFLSRTRTHHGQPPAWTPLSSNPTGSSPSACVSLGGWGSGRPALPWAASGRWGLQQTPLVGAVTQETGRQLCPQAAVFAPHVAEGAPGSSGHLRCRLGLLHPCTNGLSQACPGPQQHLLGPSAIFCSGRVSGACQTLCDRLQAPAGTCPSSPFLGCVVCSLESTHVVSMFPRTKGLQLK